jgi:hypothetical protein
MVAIAMCLRKDDLDGSVSCLACPRSSTYQFKGSLGSSEGCGIRTIPFLVLRLGARDESSLSEEESSLCCSPISASRRTSVLGLQALVTVGGLLTNMGGSRLLRHLEMLRGGLREAQGIDRSRMDSNFYTLGSPAPCPTALATAPDSQWPHVRGVPILPVKLAPSSCWGLVEAIEAIEAIEAMLGSRRSHPWMGWVEA